MKELWFSIHKLIDIIRIIGLWIGIESNCQVQMSILAKHYVTAEFSISKNRYLFSSAGQEQTMILLTEFGLKLIHIS